MADIGIPSGRERLSDVGYNPDSRASRDSHAGGGPGARDVEFDEFIRRTEFDYPAWWTRSRLVQDFLFLCDDPYWNSFICIMSIAGIVWVAINLRFTAFLVLDIVYNVAYAIHIFGLTYSLLMKMEASEITFFRALAFLVDMATFSHYVSKDEDFKLLCYYLRLHRPFSYLWALNEKNLKSSVLGTTLKFCYIFLVMRVTWALIWLNVDSLERTYNLEGVSDTQRALNEMKSMEDSLQPLSEDNVSVIKFLTAFYLINKMYIPIGPSVPPASDLERLTCLAIMMSGCLVVTAFAVAALSIVISHYMRPEESFRARYRLIIKDMKDSKVPPEQRERVEAFYKMYWHKQRAVSTTQLLPVFPPTLPATIFADVYFEATQKSKILCDLSYQFLSELCKKMETIHYIPGDAIIKRLSNKIAYIYITYGDIELVTAEDDNTAILRLTRGSVLTPMGVCVPAGLGKAHLQVRAATFCTAHVLKGKDMWKVIIKHGRTDEETEIILGAFNDHLERVKTHFGAKVQETVIHKSSTFHFKRCLAALKDAKDAKGQLILARTDMFLEVAESYIMRNRADSTLTDESDAICLRPTFPYILQPSSSLQRVWSMFTAAIIVAVCFAHPYYMVFCKEVPMSFRFFDYLVTIVFILDLYLYLATGANVEEGVPITLAQTSAQQMRSLWFVVDVLGTAPIFEFIGNGHFAGINKLLRLPKVFRVLKALEESCVYQSHILRFMSYTLLMLIACYLTAALQQGFMCFQFGYCLVTNLTHSPFWEQQPLDEITISHRVAFAMYWAMSMMDFTAHKETLDIGNWQNILYTLLVLEILTVLRIFMEAVYSATILVTTALREDYDAEISVVKNFMIRNQVDPVLRKRFISYLQLCWYTDKAYAMTNNRSIFYDLPPHVFQDIVAKQRSKYILVLPFMKFVSHEDQKTISAKAKLFYTSPNEILLNTGDISKEMYVIKRGICEILSPDTKTVVGLLDAKCHFGVLGCLLRLPAYYTIRTVTNVQVFSISAKYLTRALEVPQIKSTLDYSRKQPEFQRLQSRREPFLSYEEPPPIPNRELFPLPRKHEPDNDFLLPFYRLGFFSILRYIFPRFTIRPDGTYLIRYEWFRASCAMLSAMVFPSYTYLSIQWPWLYYVTMLLDISAIYDIFQRMLIAYYDESGILIYHPSSTAAHYMKGAFFIDFLGCISLEALEMHPVEEGTKNLVTLMEQFLMMNRLLQLYRVPGAMMVLKNVIERRDILIIFKAIPLFIVLVNVLTSFFVLLSVNIYYQIDTGQWEIVPLDDKGGSWINLFGNQFRFNLTESPSNMYLGTYFWMVYEVSTTGYNTIRPSNINLLWLLFTGMLTGGMMITYFSVRIISIRANVNKDLAEFQEHMKDMVYYMKREALAPELQKVVLDYYEYTWDKMGGVDYRKMFKLCSQITLRTDAILHIYGPTFAKCPILTHTDISLMRIIGRAVHSAYFLRGMTVVEASDVISDMYFVDYGGIEARETVGEFSALTKLPRGSVFGNLDGKHTVCCPLTFVATSRVHLLMINSAVFHHIISDFPAVKELMTKFRTNESYILGNVVEGRTSVSQHDQGLGFSTFIVTKRKGLIKHLYFQDKYIQIFLILVSAVCVYLDVYNAGFQDNRIQLVILLYCLDFCFSFKILVQLILPLIVDSVNIRRLLLPQRKAYFRGEFKYDLLSLIPIELLCFLSDKHQWRIFAVLRLNRVLRIVTVYKGLMRHQQRITINLTLTTTLKAILWFTLFVHITSCLWYFIGNVEEWRHTKSSWIYKDDGTSWCRNEYVCSLYFVLTTFTQNGVGDIMPKQKSEVIFVIILQIVSTMMYLIYVGEFSNIIQYQSFRACSFYSKYLELEDFMKNNRVSKNLMHMVNKYSLHMWREVRGMQEPHFLRTAPRALRLEIMSAAYLHHLTRHHVFENCESAFLRQLVGCLQLMTYNEDMYVVKSSEITDSMYLIHTGKIEEIADESHKVPRIYPAGSYFGVVQGLMHDMPYTHSYRTLLKSQVLTLRFDDWYYLLKHYPSSQEVIQRHMKYDNKGDGGGGGGGETTDDSWKQKFMQKFMQAPKPRRDQKGRRVTVVTEVDRETPSISPAEHRRDSRRRSKRDSERHSTYKQHSEQKERASHSKPPPLHLPQPGEMTSPSKTSMFSKPEAPMWRPDDDKPITLQPGLWPTTRKDLHKDTKQAYLEDPDQINLNEKRMEESNAVPKSLKENEISATNSLQIEPKEQPTMPETGQTKNEEKDGLQQLLANVSGTTVTSHEQHMVTVDMIDNKDQDEKNTQIKREKASFDITGQKRLEEHEEMNKISSDVVKNEIKEKFVTKDTHTVREHEESIPEIFAHIRGRSESDELEKYQLQINERQKSDMMSINLTASNKDIEQEESKIITVDISGDNFDKGKESSLSTKIARARSKINLDPISQELIQMQKTFEDKDIPTTSTIIAKDTKKDKRVSLQELMTNKTKQPEEENEIEIERQESKILAVDLSGDSYKRTSLPIKIDLNRARSRTNLDFYAHETKKVYEDTNISTNLSFIDKEKVKEDQVSLQELMIGKAGKSEEEKDTEIEREESKIITVDLFEDNLKRTSLPTKTDFSRTRSKTNLDPYAQEIIQTQKTFENTDTAKQVSSQELMTEKSGKTEEEQEIEIEREESKIITVDLSEDNLTRTSLSTKMDLSRARSKTNVDFGSQKILQEQETLEDEELHTTSAILNKDVKEVEPSPQKQMTGKSERLEIDLNREKSKLYLPEKGKTQEAPKDNHIPTTSFMDTIKKEEEIIQEPVIDRVKKFERMKRTEIKREESKNIPVKTSISREIRDIGHDKTNITRSTSSLADLGRQTSAAKIDVTQDKSNRGQDRYERGRLKSVIDPSVVQRLLNSENSGLVDDDGIPINSNDKDKEKKKETPAPLQGQMKDRMSTTKGRRLIRVRYEENKETKSEYSDVEIPKKISDSDVHFSRPPDKTALSGRSLRLMDSDVNLLRTAKPNDEPSAALGSNTSLSTVTSRITFGRSTKKKTENKKER